MKRLSLATAALCAALSLATAQPAEFLAHYNGMINSSRLFVTYCMVGEHICREIEMKAWGQLCGDHRIAENYLKNNPNFAQLYHYTSWRCETHNPNDNPPSGKSGKARTAKETHHSTTTISGRVTANIGTVGTGRCEEGYQLVEVAGREFMCARDLKKPIQ